MIQTIERKNVNTGEIENYGVELEAQYRINSHWQLSTNHALLHMEHPIVAAPKYKGFLGVDFRCCQKLTLNAGLQYVNGLYTAVGEKEKTENFCLLNLAASYALTRHIGLWVRGENLLGKSYEFNLGYPMPHATFMGGVTFNF
jgi:iron complex outermembrane receptor protein